MAENVSRIIVEWKRGYFVFILKWGSLFKSFAFAFFVFVSCVLFLFLLSCWRYGR